MKLQSYRKKGINAYLLLVGDAIESADYGSPATMEDANRAHQSKSHVVAFNLSEKPDGIYRYKSADGHKSVIGWVSIQAGEVVELFDVEPKPLISSILPELEGSPKQIAWAEKIRAHFLSIVGDRVTDYSKDSAAYEALDGLVMAKSWIDNRDKLNPQKFIDRVNALEAEWEAGQLDQALQEAIEDAISDTRITAHDELISEAEVYAIVYPDCIHVVSLVTGMGARLPNNRKYVGTQGNMRWQYDLERLSELKNCKLIEFFLDSEGNKIE